MGEPALWFDWIKVAAFVSGLIFGGMAMTSVSLVWFRTQKLTLVAGWLATLGTVMISMSIYQSIEIEGAGFKAKLAEIESTTQDLYAAFENRPAGPPGPTGRPGPPGPSGKLSKPQLALLNEIHEESQESMRKLSSAESNLVALKNELASLSENQKETRAMVSQYKESPSGANFFAAQAPKALSDPMLSVLPGVENWELKAESSRECYDVWPSFHQSKYAPILTLSMGESGLSSGELKRALCWLRLGFATFNAYEIVAVVPTRKLEAHEVDSNFLNSEMEKLYKYLISNGVKEGSIGGITEGDVNSPQIEVSKLI